MSNLSPGQADRLFTRACELRDEEQFAEAQHLLEQLQGICGHLVNYWLVLGYVRKMQNLLDQAIVAFRRGSEIEPASRLASLGVFHCLWRKGECDLAFEEMKRFATVSDSDEYREIVASILQNATDRNSGGPPRA